MKSVLLLLATAGIALANTAPTVVIQSATMRPGTTLMDVVYRVNDPDDATVKTRALAFVDGVRSFKKVIKPVTFVEGTASKLGDSVPANVDHTLTWNVGADWNTDLGKVKFEVLAMDQRGLLPLDWITIPAAGGKPAMTISKDAPTDAQVLSACFWRYAGGDSGLTLANGVLRGTSANGVFNGVDLVSDTTVNAYGAPFIFKRMNLAAVDTTEMRYVTNSARADLLNSTWHAVDRPYDGISIVIGWGTNDLGQTSIPAGLNGISAIAAGRFHSLALKSDGSVVGWGRNIFDSIPVGIDGVTAISAAECYSLMLKSDGTVIARGWSNQGQLPAGLSEVTAIAAGNNHSLALKNDGKVIAWGDNSFGQTKIPTGITGVTAIAAGENHSLALKSDGTVVVWGEENYGVTVIPAGLGNVTAIAAGHFHNLALRNDGTVVAWGRNNAGQASVPAGLSGVTAISAGEGYSLALKSDGTVVAWGADEQSTIPSGLDGVTAIAAGYNHIIVLKAKAQ